MSLTFKPKFVSKIDDFLMNFDQTHPVKSMAQQQEIAKHARIASLRDGISIPLATTSTPDEIKIWEGF